MKDKPRKSHSRHHSSVKDRHHKHHDDHWKFLDRYISHSLTDGEKIEFSDDIERLKIAWKLTSKKTMKKLYKFHITWTEKVSFLLSVSLLCLIEYIFLCYSFYLPYFYICLLLPLILGRFFYYHSRGWHFYLLDYCYFSNLTFVFFILVYPSSTILWQCCYLSANGPLLAAIITWKNSLVFHDIDRIISVVLHAFPSLVTYSFRWHQVSSNQECYSEPMMFSSFAASMMLYFVWQSAYFIKVIVIDAQYLEEHQNFDFSERWITKRLKPGTFLHKLYNIHPQSRLYKGLMYSLSQFVFTFITQIPCFLFYSSHFFHSVALIAVYLICTWYGGCFYLARVVESKQAKLDRKEREEKEAREALKAQSEAANKQKMQSALLPGASLMSQPLSSSAYPPAPSSLASTQNPSQNPYADIKAASERGNAQDAFTNALSPTSAAADSLEQQSTHGATALLPYPLTLRPPQHHSLLSPSLQMRSSSSSSSPPPSSSVSTPQSTSSLSSLSSSDLSDSEGALSLTDAESESDLLDYISPVLLTFSSPQPITTAPFLLPHITKQPKVFAESETTDSETEHFEEEFSESDVSEGKEK
ncbi:putative membrane transporter [Monocercomonoides exilis]|uniref:putative membrane transporter n=1 Tax=Monocercomonoides exilis TaxID=2049356 RepID=UPI00355A1F0F|nr:putative membrane transporter [Monocercomonoides exilis]|eukprot:MONOS_8077.1-p1 / transcript=MONOS_8077.1 / gene=MONOS_8077 / organism=Monocercomonoides_exilis_PA203 / gene_product=membrane transporter, putative / transcript_product=membrane transporter, putative / location=Mono_scaffold00295:5873-8254(-) / protein_length=585 / sequence_SO=supercontig / SO=protein_coding / is_pseudo=false